MSKKNALLFHSTDKDKAVEELHKAAKTITNHARARDLAVKLEWDKFTREWVVWLMDRT